MQAARFNRKDGGRLTELAGIRFRFMDTAFSPQALLEVEARCDEAFAFAHHAAYTRLGIAQSGAENVGQVQRDTFLRFVASRLDDVLDALTVQCIAPVVRRRYGERGARLLPRVTHKGLRPHPLSQLQAFVPGALAAGAMRASEQMQDAFNELAGLPADAGRDSEEAQAMAEAGHAQANTGNVHTQVPGPGRGHVGEATTTERNARLQQIVDSMSDEGAQDG